METENRSETIEALRAHVPPKYFPGMIELSTPMLKAILTFYREGGTESELDYYFTKDENVKEIKKSIRVKFFMDGIEHTPLNLANGDSIGVNTKKVKKHFFESYELVQMFGWVLLFGALVLGWSRV